MDRRGGDAAAGMRAGGLPGSGAEQAGVQGGRWEGPWGEGGEMGGVHNVKHTGAMRRLQGWEGGEGWWMRGSAAVPHGISPLT